MKNLVKFQGVMFDDWVKSSEGIYSQICKKCATKHKIGKHSLSVSGAEEICGVKDCNNVSDYYIDMVMFEEEHGE